jgi:hypothetical protein
LSSYLIGSYIFKYKITIITPFNGSFKIQGK